MLDTAQKLISWSCEANAGIKSFTSSILVDSNNLILPFYGMVVRRVKVATEGYRISSVGCALQKVMGVVGKKHWYMLEKSNSTV